MKITFKSPKEIVVVKEIKKTIPEININEIVDNSERKTVRAFTKELGVITLWEGDAYDTIGQWTDASVLKRINEIYK
jgi:hypothetical protein